MRFPLLAAQHRWLIFHLHTGRLSVGISANVWRLNMTTTIPVVRRGSDRGSVVAMSLSLRTDISWIRKALRIGGGDIQVLKAIMAVTE